MMNIQLEARFANVDVFRYFPASDARRKPTAILVLPGVLSRWNEQVAPVIDILARYGTVFGVNYTDKAWYTDQIVDSITDFIDHELRSYDQLVIFGVSIGGMIMPDIVSATKRSHDTIGALIIDAPYGVDTLMTMPPSFRWFFQLGVYNVLNGPVGNWARETFMSVPPKPENIEVPAGIIDVDGYKIKVIGDAKLGLSHHPWHMFGSQSAYMSRHTPKTGPLRDVKVVYTACVSAKNDTVAQPKSLDRWHQELPNLEIIEVDTAHAGFREGLPTWQVKLVEAFDALGMINN